MTALSSDNEIQAQLDALDAMDHAALRLRWRQHYRTDPPRRVSRELLVLGIGWKIQERAFGGFSAATKRQLNDLAKSLDNKSEVDRNHVLRLRPGARLVREWRGVAHTVIVSDNGFEWRGRQCQSLSAIAREITGSHWSGPRFFGLTGKRNPAPAAMGDSEDG